MKKQHAVFLLSLFAGLCISAVSRAQPGVIHPFSCVAQINGYGNYRLAGKTFFIVPADASVPFSDLTFKEYAGYLCCALELSGARCTQDIGKADMYVTIFWGHETQTTTHMEKEPVEGIVGQTTTTTKVKTPPQSGSASSAGQPQGGHASDSVTTITQVDYQMGTVAYKEVCVTDTWHHYTLDVNAFENQAGVAGAPLWQLTAQSVLPQENPRWVFPGMMWASAGEYGRKTTCDKEMHTNDPALQEFIEYGGDRSCRVYPRCANRSTIPGFTVFYVRNGVDGIEIVLENTSAVKGLVISPHMRIQPSQGKELSVTYAGQGWPRKQLKLGKKVNLKAGQHLCLRFGAIPERESAVSLISESGIRIDNIALK